ncbi:MAG: hypothetical protein FWG70_09680 [Oscillospiraceae bacterium]|nr:hypothetical protein [Oscillospiraceae bacterium]
MKKAILILFLSILFLGIIYGLIFGFPGERAMIIKNAKKYLVNVYGITPTELQIVNFISAYPVHIRVETETEDFWFFVSAKRFEYNNFYDNYLVKKTEYILANDLKEYVYDIFGSDRRVYININSNNLDEFSFDELSENPQLAFDLKKNYTCGISIYKTPTQENNDINYSILYDIYIYVFQIGLNPYNIRFYLEDIDLIVNIFKDKHTRNNRTFPEINSLDDFTQLFQEQFTMNVEHS